MNPSGVAFHPDLGQYSYTLTPLSEVPDTQVGQTIHKMCRNVRSNFQAPGIQKDVAAIRAGGNTGDTLADSFWYTKNRTGFRQDAELSGPLASMLNLDPQTDPIVEVLIDPEDLSQMAAPVEDCDGFASYLATILKAQGVPCKFVTVAADPRQPGQFSHVYLACTDPNSGQRVSLDASHGPFPGWECTGSGQVTRLKEWSIDGPDWGQLLIIAAVLFAAVKVWGIL